MHYYLPKAEVCVPLGFFNNNNFYRFYLFVLVKNMKYVFKIPFCNKSLSSEKEKDLHGQANVGRLESWQELGRSYASDFMRQSQEIEIALERAGKLETGSLLKMFTVMRQSHSAF